MWRHAAGRTSPDLQLPDKNIDFHPLVQECYEGAPAFVTTNIYLPSGLATAQIFVPFGSCSPKRRRLRQSRFPWRAAASPSSWPATCRGSSYSRSKTARQGPSPHFPRLTDGQFPYMLPQTQALSVILPNRRFNIMSDAFAPSHGAA